MDTFSNRPIVHVGFPKTGTKWLQKFFFPTIEEAFFLKRQQVFDLLIEPDVFDFSPEICRRRIEELAKGKRIIISEELLVGGLDIGFGAGEFIQLMANRLKLVFNDVQIVITIRNQIDIASSIYGHYVKSGGTYSVGKFFGFHYRNYRFFKNHHLFSLKFLEYDKTVNLYMKLFGKDKVKVLLFEDFVFNPEHFLNVLSNDLSVSTCGEYPTNNIQNKRLSKISVALMLFLNRFTRKNTVLKNYFFNVPSLYYRALSIAKRLDNSSFFGRNHYVIPDKTRTMISRYYRESNARLIRMSGVNRIKEYNYPL